MLVTILIIFLALILIFGMLIVFSPIAICFERIADGKKSNCLAVTFLHKRVAVFRYDFSSKQTTITLFGKTIGKIREDEEFTGEETDRSETFEEPLKQETTLSFESPQPIPDEHLTEKINKTEDVSCATPQQDVFRHENSFYTKPGTQADTAYTPEPETVKPEEQAGPGTTDSSFRRVVKQILSYYNFAVSQKRTVVRILSWLSRLVRAAFGIIRFDSLNLSIKAGCENPAITGALNGYVNGLFVMLNEGNSSRVNLTYEPVFDCGDCASVSGQVSLRTSLAMMLYPLVVALLYFPYISAYQLYRKYKKLESAKSN